MNSVKFSNKPYMDVNREERFFCALFFHALLASGDFRKKFCTLASEKISGLSLDPNQMEVYLEAAVLRDYWHDLDKSGINKESVIFSMLKDANVVPDKSIIRTLDGEGVLSSPGRWSIDKIKADSNLSAEGKRALIMLKWAFNAKPDILIISGDHVLVFEAKVESTVDYYNAGEIEPGCQFRQSQIDVQKCIIGLLKKFVPYFSHRTFHHCIIAAKSNKTNPKDEDVCQFNWLEVKGLLDGCLMDDGFTIGGFNRLEALCAGR